MKKKKLLNLDKQLANRGEKSRLSEFLHIDNSTLTRLINCEASIESYKIKIYDYVHKKNPDISMDKLFAVFEIEDKGKQKPFNFDSAFAQRVRFAIDKQKAFSGYKSDYEIVESTKGQFGKRLISVHALSDYKNGYSECRDEQQLEQLAMTLNVIPQYLTNEISLPYDYDCKEIIETIQNKISNFVLHEYEDTLEDFLNECYFSIFSELGYFHTLPDKTLTQKTILETIKLLLNYVCETQSLNYEDIILIAGSPEEIVQRMRDQIVTDLSDDEQAVLLKKERRLFEWYSTKTEISERDLLLYRNISQNPKSKEIRDLINTLYHDDIQIIKESELL